MAVIPGEAKDHTIEVWSTQGLQRDQQRIWEVPRRVRELGMTVGNKNTWPLQD